MSLHCQFPSWHGLRPLVEMASGGCVAVGAPFDSAVSASPASCPSPGGTRRPRSCGRDKRAVFHVFPELFTQNKRSACCHRLLPSRRSCDAPADHPSLAAIAIAHPPPPHPHKPALPLPLPGSYGVSTVRQRGMPPGRAGAVVARLVLPSAGFCPAHWTPVQAVSRRR